LQSAILIEVPPALGAAIKKGETGGTLPPRSPSRPEARCSLVQRTRLDELHELEVRRRRDREVRDRRFGHDRTRRAVVREPRGPREVARSAESGRIRVEGPRGGNGAGEVRPDDPR